MGRGGRVHHSPLKGAMRPDCILPTRFKQMP
jgi:hypothetical protein